MGKEILYKWAPSIMVTKYGACPKDLSQKIKKKSKTIKERRCAMRKIALSVLMGLVLLVAGTNPSSKTWAQEKEEQAPAPKEKQEELNPELKAKIEALIKQLGDNDWQTREAAQKDLIKIGNPIIYPLIIDSCIIKGTTHNLSPAYLKYDRRRD